MKKATRKLFGILLVVAVLFGMLTVNAFAVATLHPDGDPLTYAIESDDTLSVVACEGGQTAVTIPSEVDGKAVTKIAKGFLDNNTSLETLTFADGSKIETIEGAFNSCVNLKTINWGTGGALKEITKSFRGCAALETLTIPASVETIGKQSFSNCIKLSELSFAEGAALTTIEAEAFAFLGKTNEVLPATIDTLTLPAGLESLGKGAFHCIPVKHFVLEDNSKLAIIPNGFLAADGKDGKPGVGTECESFFDFIEGVFEYVSYNNPYPFTPSKVAEQCACLESVDLGDHNSLTMIGAGAFKNQLKLGEIDFGTDAESESLTIAYGAFLAMNNTEDSNAIELTFPANLTELATGTFRFAKVSKLTFSDGCKLQEIPYGFMVIEGKVARPGSEAEEDETLTRLLRDANCLTEVNFGADNHLKEIKSGAFKNQSHLTSIDFGSAAKVRSGETPITLEISYGAFAGAGNNAYLVEKGIDNALIDGIETLTLPANLTYLGSGAFRFAAVKNLVFSDGCRLSQIPYGFLALEGADGQPGTKPQWSEVEPMNITLAADRLETISFGAGNHLTSIQSGAFKNQTNLTAIDFGSAAKVRSGETPITLEISYGAFTGAGNNADLVEKGIDEALNDGIETLTLPSNLNYIGYGAFRLVRVKNLVFSDGCQLSSLPSGFMTANGQDGQPGTANSEYCTDPKWLSLASDCLETVSFGKNNSFTDIGSGTFKNQTHLKSIDFGTSTQNLSISYGAFTGAGNNADRVQQGIDKELNTGIETLTLPANLNYIGYGAFRLARVKNLVFSDGCRVRTIPSGFMTINGFDAMPGTKNAGNEYDKDPVWLSYAADVLETVSFGKNNSISTIESGTFKNQSHLKSIDFGTVASSSTYLNISYGAFTGAGNNAYLVAMGVDKAIGSGIETLTLPANLAVLGSGAFSAARVQNLVFSDGCQLYNIPSGFMSVEGADGTPGVGKDYDGKALFDETGILVQQGANSLKSVSFGKGTSLSAIQYGAFKNQTNLTKIDFGTNANGNGLSLFYGVFAGTAPETLKIPRHLSFYGQGQFKKAKVKYLVFEDGYSGSTYLPDGFLSKDNNDPNDKPILESIDFGKNNGLTKIGAGVFAGNKNLKTLDLSATNITSIEYGAFNGCGLKAITLPNNLDSLDEGAFQDLPDLETLVIGSDCKLSTLTGGVFSNCKSLTTVNLLDSNITTIEDSLKNNKSLTTVIFPKKLSSINWDSRYDDEDECPFYGCENLNTLYFAAENPSGYSMDKDSLQFLSESGTVYVPEGTTDANLLVYKEILTNAGLSFAEGKWELLRNHDLKKTDKIDATCTTAGNIEYYTCQNEGCGKYFSDAIGKTEIEKDAWIIPATGHDLKQIDKADATCTTAGNNEYYACQNEGCGKYFSDAEGKTEIEKDSWVIPAIGHDLKKTDKVDATCTTAGNSEYYTCQNEGCGKYFSDAEGKTEIEKDAWIIPATGHSFTVYTYNNDAEIGKDGTETAVCDHGCGATDTRTKEGSALAPEYENPFVDVAESEYYYTPVSWAVQQGITVGTSADTFSPDEICTRAQAVTFLWRAAGSPEVAISETFTDVVKGSYYEMAVAWALEKGVTVGTSATTFSPNAKCTRAQIVTFLYRANTKAVLFADENPFEDVAETAYYYDAVMWAVKEEIVKGKTETQFAPNDYCTRAEIMTFIYRYINE